MFSAFLDASKAFDRTNHNLLFAKLIKRNVPMCIVRLLLSWYRQQIIQVKWGTNYSCLLNICGDYAAEHEITFNCNKTIGVLFCPKKYKQPAPSNVFLNGVRVQFLDHVKYLGVWINASLRMMMTFRDKWNHYTVQQTNSEALLISALLQ